MVGLVFAIAASANFPVVPLSIVWPDLTTRGAVSGSVAGLLASVGLVALSPGVWTTTPKLRPAPFPYDIQPWSWSRSPSLYPGRYRCWTAVRRPLRSGASFSAQHVRAQTGLGIE